MMKNIATIMLGWWYSMALNNSNEYNMNGTQQDYQETEESYEDILSIVLDREEKILRDTIEEYNRYAKESSGALKIVGFTGAITALFKDLGEFSTSETNLVLLAVGLFITSLFLAMISYILTQFNSPKLTRRGLRDQVVGEDESREEALDSIGMILKGDTDEAARVLRHQKRLMIFTYIAYVLFALGVICLLVVFSTNLPGTELNSLLAR